MPDNRQPWKIRSLRAINEFLFFLNLSLVIVLRLLLFDYPLLEMRLQSRIDYYLHVPSHNALGAYVALFVVGSILALFSFLLLRLFSQQSLGAQFLHLVVGVINLVAFPVFWIYTNRATILFAGWVALSIELLIIGICAFLYSYRNLLLPSWAIIPLVVAHFWFWGVVPSKNLFFFLYFGPYTIFPMTGLCAALAWSIYVSSQSDTTIQRPLSV